MFGRRILGGPPDGFKLLLGYQVAISPFNSPLQGSYPAYWSATKVSYTPCRVNYVMAGPITSVVMA